MLLVNRAGSIDKTPVKISAEVHGGQGDLAWAR